MPKVSVLIPAYNSENYVGDAIQSILNQTFTDFELLVLDDGSTDRTWEEMQKFSDPRITLFQNEQNQGIPFSRNRLMENAQGTYLAWLDADDIALPHRLEVQVRFMDENPEVGICGSWVQYFGNSESLVKNPILDNEIKSKNLFLPCICQSSTIIRKKLITNNQLSFPLCLEVSQDYAMEVFVGSLSKQANISEPLTFVRSHLNRISNQKNRLQALSLQYIQKLMLKKIEIIPTAEELLLHHQVVKSFENPITIRTLQKIDAWLTKIKKANDMKQIYPEPEFTQMLQEIWLKNMAGYSKLGLGFWKLFTQSILSPYLEEFSLGQKLKFFVKCILKK